MIKKKYALVTGVAGFIGFHLALRLLQDNYFVIGLDNMNAYYDTKLKNYRLKKLYDEKKTNRYDFIFKKADLTDKSLLTAIFHDYKFDLVVNLAAQAGVRHSLDNPHSYIGSNLSGFLNVLECCRFNKPKHLIFASSSSVYGMNKKNPFSSSDRVDYPVSLYAATKRSNELMAFSYSHLFDIPITGLRFFTVYGPYGRPDMAYYKFTEAIERNEEISVFNKGKMKRDFTYIDDIIDGLTKIVSKVPQKEYHAGTEAKALFQIYNIGNNQPVTLTKFIKSIEKATGKVANKKYLPMQLGDVTSTFANIDPLIKDTGFEPKTTIDQGMKKFVSWYREYSGINGKNISEKRKP